MPGTAPFWTILPCSSDYSEFREKFPDLHILWTGHLHSTCHRLEKKPDYMDNFVLSYGAFIKVPLNCSGQE